VSGAADWGRVFRAEAPRLRRFLRRLAPRLSGEDLAQDSFARVCAMAPETVISPRALLYRTARNLAINAGKRAAAGPVLGAERLPSEPVSSELDPEERLLLAEALGRLNQALAALPEHKRTALLLFKAEGRSYKEIAAHLGVSPRTVERYVADAMAHCHKELRGFREE
jgi:RNA polymerase sigma factor (sigma-70 family)